jgi:hypothetical protein
MQIDITLNITKDNQQQIKKLLEELKDSKAISEYSLRDYKELINDYDFD